MKLRLLFATLMVMIITCASVEAQIYETVSSTTTKIKIDKPSNVTWFARLGVTVNNTLLGDDFDDLTALQKNGYHLVVGMEKPITRTTNFFWGAQAGVTGATVGIDEWQDGGSSWSESSPSYSCLRSSFFIGPTIGYHKKLNKTLSFDFHISPQLQASFTDFDTYYVNGIYKDNKKTYYEGWEYDLDCGRSFAFELGVGLWIKRFIVDIGYRHNSNLGNQDYIRGLNSFMFTIGYAFKQPQ